MTDSQQWLSRKYIAYRTLTSMWFVGAVWLYFYRIFITDQQVGILDGMAFAIGLLAEVPSGALADKFGRDKVVRLGQILAGSGMLIQAAGSDFLPLFVGQAVMMVGVSLVSGADEALFFEKLKFKRTSADWRKLVMRGSQVALIGSVVTLVMGGWMHTINPRIPWVLNGLVFIAAALLIWSVKDERVRKARQKFLPELKDYLHDIKTGFAQFRLPKLWLYVPFIITVQGLFYATGYGLLRLILLDRFHFDPFWGSVAVASSSLITVGLLAYMHKNADSLSEKRVLASIGLIAASSLLLSVANIGLWGYVVILALYAGEHVLQPFISEVLNNRAPENQRATVLSVASFFKTLPYVFLAPIIGYLSTNGKMEYFLVAWALLIILAVALYMSAKKRDTHVVLVEE
ncbi:MAG TPA: MFS transporter [Candidatus Saccharimonadales bacterium]|nr:MFS transporter [Candidatus Saccharimonadales bacterium]